MDNDAWWDWRNDRRPSAAERHSRNGGLAGRADLELPPQARRSPRRPRFDARPHRHGSGPRDGGKDDLSHDALGPFNRRVAPAGAGRAAENIAYGYDNFEKTLGQWIDSSGHRKNLLLHNASRVGIASAKNASGKRTYWAMVIAGDYEPKGKGRKKDKEPLVAVKREVAPASKPKSSNCHVKLLGLCI